MTVETNVEKRRGSPNPLAFHLVATLVKLQREMLAAGPEDPIKAITKNIEKMQRILDALKTWQQHPYQRQNFYAPVVWQSGNSRLFDYGGFTSAKNPPAVLVIPSLVNKPYILDLSPENSLMRGLAAAGLRPFLLDWGEPSVAESAFDLNAYVTERAIPALNKIDAITDASIGVLGYCMGGTLAATLPLLSNKISALSTIGTPWDFSEPSENRLLLHQLGSVDNGQFLSTTIQKLSNVFGGLPFEFLQYLFAAIDPNQFAAKFLRFSQMDAMSPEAKQFVIIEDWLNDGLALTGPAADDLLVKWHIQNQIINGDWTINDTVIGAEKITVPGLFICGKTDSISPSKSALALPNRVKNATVIQPNTGHVGMIVGSKSHTDVVLPIAQFMLKHS